MIITHIYLFSTGYLQLSRNVNTYRVECERRAEVLLVYSLQQSLCVSVRTVQDQNPFTCRRSDAFFTFSTLYGARGSEEVLVAYLVLV